MTTYGLKVANTQENFDILNRVDSWWINYEDDELIEVEFDSKQDCDDMYVMLQESSRPWAHRS